MTRRSTDTPPRDLSEALVRGVRTPLHSLLGFLELLAMTGLDGDQRRLLEQAMAGAEGVGAASARLLALVGARDAAGPVREVTPRALVDLAVDAAPRAAGTAVTVRCGPGLAERVLTDVTAARQLLAELVDNAAAHGGGPVTVTVAAEPGTGPGKPGTALAISVATRGPAVPGEVARALEGTGPRVDGPGVGVEVVRALARSLDAAVRVDGGAVTVRWHVQAVAPVPVVPPAAPVPAPRPASGPASSAGPLRVLLAEDNAVNRLLAERQLARLGHQLTSVPTGAGALEALRRERFDAVLLDLHLPDGSGADVARAVRSMPGPAGRVPIVAVTADASPGTRETCLAAGMDSYLTKPLDIGHLAAALDRCRPGTASEPVPAGEPALDRAALDRLAAAVGGDTAAVQEILTAYLAELPGRRLRIAAAARRGSGTGLQSAAESLRGSSEAVGALRLAAGCARLSVAAGADRFPDALAALPGLLEECAAVQQEMQPLVDAAVR